MSEHASEVVILAEDQEHHNLVWHSLRNCAQYRRRMGRVRKVALPGSRGSGSQYVREQVPVQVAACRARRARTLLLVVTDADNLTAAGREQTLHDELARAGREPVADEEMVIIIVPKWQVETWDRCLLGQPVREDDPDPDRPPVAAGEITTAAGALYDWARPNAAVGATCVESLRAALPRWSRVG